ncbi:MAG: amidohydrolase, partial [Planctomycetaceae bacterium]
SAGIPREQLEAPGIGPKERCERIVAGLPQIQNTVQYSWFQEICREFFGFDEPQIETGNWERLYDSAQKVLDQPDWEAKVIERSQLEGVFLTNDFDDPLEGFDTSFYIPCLRTDELVFKISSPAVRARFQSATGSNPATARELRAGLARLFERFVSRGARACAISLPPDFAPEPIPDTQADILLEKLARGLALDQPGLRRIAQAIFWMIAGLCDEHRLPFDLMIGVNRQVYPAGVFQGQYLFDSRCSLLPYAALFRAFPRVAFPVSVLSVGLNQELVAYSWIFPNVIAHGHWWYANIPAFILADCRSRLQAVPQTKQIGYYSDMYKLEFALPKFAMYRRILATALAEDFVIGRGWSEERAVALGRTVLRGNVDRLFPPHGK